MESMNIKNTVFLAVALFSLPLIAADDGDSKRSAAQNQNPANPVVDANSISLDDYDAVARRLEELRRQSDVKAAQDKEAKRHAAEAELNRFAQVRHSVANANGDSGNGPTIEEELGINNKVPRDQQIQEWLRMLEADRMARLDRAIEGSSGKSDRERHIDKNIQKVLGTLVAQKTAVDFGLGYAEGQVLAQRDRGYRNSITFADRAQQAIGDGIQGGIEKLTAHAVITAGSALANHGKHLVHHHIMLSAEDRDRKTKMQEMSKNLQKVNEEIAIAQAELVEYQKKMQLKQLRSKLKEIKDAEQAGQDLLQELEIEGLEQEEAVDEQQGQENPQAAK